ncbi:hypothetical protein [Sphingobacterium sp. BIGb0165]|uniref:hypothetical protein n=1 Tax=Sphingobacterium sp. BIGb0165 TaxID=2940615 RepID=UPI00216820F8|nr:hypothetical protein [Sphingobacterium sp. BIGb0165]MCS4225821.1 hypothetical protein [Sphingobacterium sp. BIGb0165]
MASYLSESFSEIKLIKELNNSGSEFYFAVDNNTVIGYLKLNTGKSQSEIQDENKRKKKLTNV